MLRPDFTVANLGELSTLYVVNVEEGANVWVESEGDYWTLKKNSGAAIGPDTIAPLPGAPTAGATNARWLRGSGSGGGSAAALAGVIYREGAVNPEAPVYAHWADAVVAAQATGGPTSIYVDDSLAPCVATAGIYNLTGIRVVGLRTGVFSTPALECLDGTVFQGVQFDFDEIVINTSSTTPVITGAHRINFSNGATLSDGSVGGVAPFLRATGTSFIKCTSDVTINSLATGPSIQANAAIFIELFDNAIVNSSAVTGAGLIEFDYFSSAAFASNGQAGATNLRLRNKTGLPGFSFAAAASLSGLGSNAVQNVPPGSSLVTSSANLTLGYLMTAGGAGSVQNLSRLDIQLIGDALNVAGQTITITLLDNGAAIPGAVITGIPTTAGTQVASLDFPFYLIAAGRTLTAHIQPSAVLTAPVTDVMIVTL